jgi:hypothetical protein
VSGTTVILDVPPAAFEGLRIMGLAQRRRAESKKHKNNANDSHRALRQYAAATNRPHSSNISKADHGVFF